MWDDEAHGFGSIGFRSGRAWGWQDWGLCAAGGLVSVGAILFAAKGFSIGLGLVAAAAAALIVTLGARRLRNEDGDRPGSPETHRRGRTSRRRQRR